MKTMTKQALMLAAAGILAISVATPTFARNGRIAAAAGIGFVAGTVLGAAAANANAGYYYDPGYAYVPAPAPVYGYAKGSYAYVPSRSAHPSFDVYNDKGYVGSDPDPRIRLHLLQESNDR